MQRYSLAYPGRLILGHVSPFTEVLFRAGPVAFCVDSVSVSKIKFCLFDQAGGLLELATP